MKLFILDDSLERLKRFRKECHSSWTVITAMTYLEGIERVRGEKFDIMFLDHDLNQEDEGSRDVKKENSGTNFAKWLVKNYDHDCPIIIHSLNPVGGNSMMKILEDKFSRVFYHPFAWQDVREIIKF